MSRDGSGNYTLPAGNPVVTGTIISSNWANSTLSDLATAMTDSLSRSALGGMNAPLRLVDGSVSAPGLAWNTEINSGFYRPSPGTVRLSLQGTERVRFENSGPSVSVFATASGDVLSLTDGTVFGRHHLVGGRYSFGSGSAHEVRIQTNSVDRVTLNTSGNVTINSPTSGSTLTVNAPTPITSNSIVTTGIVDVGGVRAIIGPTSASSTNGGQIRLRDDTGTQRWLIGHGGSAGATSFLFYDLVADATRMSISSAGNVNITAPSSGVTLRAEGVGNSQVLRLNVPTGTWGGLDLLRNNTQQWSILNNFDAADELAIYSHATGSSRIRITGGGNVTINAPNSGYCLTLNGTGNAGGEPLFMNVGASGGILLQGSGNLSTIIHNSSTGMFIGTFNSQPLNFTTTNVARLTINSGGGLIVGAPASASTALALPASAAGYSPVRLPHGVAPTSPQDGDMWTTTAGLFVRINGTTVGPLT